MKDKEKQIKLLTKRISKIQNKGVKDIPNFTNVFIDNQELAEELLKHYQLVDKNSVVLSKEEWEQIKKAKENFDNSYPQPKNMDLPILINMAKEKERKETAEKYKVAMMLSIQEMQKYLEITEEQAKILYHHNAEIAKQFSVDVKE
jgi:hypothetical protein